VREIVLLLPILPALSVLLPILACIVWSTKDKGTKSRRQQENIEKGKWIYNGELIVRTLPDKRINNIYTCVDQEGKEYKISRETLKFSFDKWE